MTDEELNIIEARANAATEGPWRYEDDAVIEVRSGGDAWICQTFSKGEEDFINHKGNGEFIAHARTDIPALIAEIRRLKDVAT